MDLLFGQKIAATDRWIGTLRGVVADIDSRKVTHLLVKRGFLFPSWLEIPVSNMRGHDHESIFLDISMNEAIASPANQDEGTQPVLSLSPETLIVANGPSLRLKGLRYDNATLALTHLLVHERGNEDFVVSIGIVSDLTSERAEVGLSPTDIDSTPMYRLDEAITADLWEHLYASEDIPDIDLRSVVIEVAEGNVSLSGNSRLPITSEAIGTQRTSRWR